MSLPDYLLDEDEAMCQVCGTLFIGRGRHCDQCLREAYDLYAEERAERILEDYYKKQKGKS